MLSFRERCTRSFLMRRFICSVCTACILVTWRSACLMRTALILSSTCVAAIAWAAASIRVAACWMRVWSCALSDAVRLVKATVPCKHFRYTSWNAVKRICFRGRRIGVAPRQHLLLALCVSIRARIDDLSTVPETMLGKGLHKTGRPKYTATVHLSSPRRVLTLVG